MIFMVAASQVGCGPAAPTVPLGPINGPFAVSDYFTPSGHMGDGQELGFVHADVQNRCKDRPANARGYCYHFTYLKRGDTYGWAGVYWVYPANNWGSRQGIAVENPLDFKQVRFKVASDVPLFVGFFFGGISDGRLPYKDQIKGEGSAMVDQDWQDVRMEIFHDETSPLTHLIGAFGWSMRYPDGSQQSEPHFPNGDGAVHLFLDDIVWDTEPPPPPDAAPRLLKPQAVRQDDSKGLGQVPSFETLLTGADKQ